MTLISYLVDSSPPCYSSTFSASKQLLKRKIGIYVCVCMCMGVWTNTTQSIADQQLLRRVYGHSTDKPMLPEQKQLQRTSKTGTHISHTHTHTRIHTTHTHTHTSHTHSLTSLSLSHTIHTHNTHTQHTHTHTGVGVFFQRTQGYLVKLGGHTVLGIKSLKKRWFVLRGTQLSYYKDEMCVQPLKKSIDLRGRLVRLVPAEGFCFEIAHKVCVYVCVCVCVCICVCVCVCVYVCIGMLIYTTKHAINALIYIKHSQDHLRTYRLYATNYSDLQRWIRSVRVACVQQ